MRRAPLRAVAFLPVGFAGLALGAFVYGCTIMNGLTVPEREAGAPTGDAAEAGPVDLCDHDYVPFDPPQIVEDGDLSFVTAIRSIDLGLDAGVTEAGTPRLSGLDLDRTCTCPAAPSCITPDRTVCDDERGRDNTFVALMRGLQSTQGLDIQASVTTDLAKGANGLLLIVQDYNGKEDDSSVKLTLAMSPGHRKVFADGGLSKKEPPTFTRADRWVLDNEQFFTLDGASTGKLRQSGYVKGGKLVVKLTEGEIRFGDEGLTIKLAEGFLIGDIEKTLEPDGQGSFIVARGKLGGRWGAKGALEGAREVRLSEGLPKLCRLPDVYKAIKDGVCKGVDIRAKATDDGQGLPCDAVSLAVEFVGAPGSTGDIYDGGPPQDCPPVQPGETDCSP
jgi:hypothetical protein